MGLDPERGIEQFIEYRKTQVGESSIRNDKARLKYFLKYLEEEEIDDLNDLTGRDLHNFVAWRRTDLKAITLQKQLSSVREFLRWAADVEAVEDGLAERVHSPEVPDGAEARDEHIKPDRAGAALNYYDRYEHASRRHVVLALLWRTGMRRSALHALDVEDLRPDEDAVVVKHRPESGTGLKNDSDGERWVYLGPRWYQVVEDWVAGPRPDVTDDYGRAPLVATSRGRAAGGTIQVDAYSATRPCEYGAGCPHDRDPLTCEAAQSGSTASKCPSSMGPHALRRGAITSHLLDDVPPEVVSERMDVSLEVLYRHYDARRPDEKMNQRRKFL